MSQLIVALDVPTLDEAKKLVDELDDVVDIFKIGHQMFTAYGPDMVRYLQARGKKVFLDLKFHDIPNTVANAVASAVNLSIPLEDAPDYQPLFMLNVHTCGGEEMMKRAAESCQKEAQKLGIPKPLIIGVTVLTSDANGDNMSSIVVERALLAKQCGLDGVVASALETKSLREKLGEDFIIVTPGIRPADAEAGDQKRIATPSLAVQHGSSYLVVGRPIVQASSPVQATKNILEEIKTS